jgi:hemolysin III
MNEHVATVDQSILIERSPALSDEAANFITHAFGFTLSVMGATHLLLLAYARGDEWQFLGCGIYATTLVALYAASTLSHSFQDQSLRRFFRMLDQVCIFLLIAGSYTPFGLMYLREGWLWGITAVMWGLAIFGVYFKVMYSRLQNVSTSTYVMMGWLPVVAIDPILTRFPTPALLWIVAGGMCYTVGVYFLTNDDKRYFHAVWHLLVIAGSICHYVAVRSSLV